MHGGDEMEDVTALTPSFFRHEYGRLVALLSRRVGVRHLEAIEDAIQGALVAAVDTWPRAGLPQNPSAWLYRVALRRLIGELRQSARRAELLAQHAVDVDVLGDADAELEATLHGEIPDALLRMLFLCCDDALPTGAQLVLALKVLCGFDVREIAERLFLSEANVYKRLERARTRLRDVDGLAVGDLAPSQLAARLAGVRTILYVIFTEGHFSSHADGAIRRELCDDAIRLATALAEHPVGAEPETFALLALMHLHVARLPARLDGSGGLLLLDEQERSLWDGGEIARGLEWLARSAEGTTFSRFHAEAGIAAEHCLAPSFAQTRWGRIIECYELLERLAPSALHTLHRAVAVAELHGPAAGLALLEHEAAPSWLTGSYLWAAVLADLHRRNGDAEAAARYRVDALARAPSPAVRDVLDRRLSGPLELRPPSRRRH